VSEPDLVPAPGFDVSRATAVFFEWLVSKGHAERAMSAFAASNDHQWRHQDSTAADARCTLRPCRALAISEALGHCLTYQHGLAEFRREFGFATAGDLFLGDARPRLRLLREAAREIAHASEERHQREAEPTRDRPAREPGHDHDLLCVAPALVVEHIEAVLTELEMLVGDLRAYPNVPGLRKRAGRGRPKEELLTLVWQTLRAGGFTYREIATNVPPSDAGDNIEEVINRIEKRVKDEMLWVTDNQPDERFILKVTTVRAADADVSTAEPPKEPANPTGGPNAPAATAENIRDVFSPADRPAETAHVEVDSDHHADDTKTDERKA